MKLFKNRTVLGIFCIAVSLLICFAITPLVNAGLSKKVAIVRFNQMVQEGEQITKNMVDVVEVGNHNLPENVVRNLADVEGKYLTATVYAGDYILTDKISEEPSAENKYLYNLNGEKQAMSITINTFAEGLSGKLKSGDIVSVIAPDYLGSGETVIPAELKYVEVIAVTAKSGYDANTEEQRTEEEEKELPSTVTILVRPEQSRLLARLEAEGEIHLSLVFRGEAEKASEFIEAQDQVLDEMKAEEEADTQGDGATEEGVTSEDGKISPQMNADSETRTGETETNTDGEE
ncbi:Flp pilus assembly protein CpaB [Agathobacter rectalis]|jgi:pilus assembly protein CpaB|uniref:Flp pilus assembly protein CpaB n=1 Tax=Agathobacter rectalis TaxID=39491 RepID=UPI0027D292E8|nr:Flp pilus assembly protein CpaB [Agathobacter rectalis]MCB7111315.1 Flp pilus assembly protein CpaB [Agathobacter rectalis]MCG4814531.1 Flp pilus assembly protein CpaB [Agathobacter rectalis]